MTTKKKKITIDLDESVINTIDEDRKRSGMSRDQYIENALVNHLRPHE